MLQHELNCKKGLDWEIAGFAPAGFLFLKVHSKRNFLYYHGDAIRKSNGIAGLKDDSNRNLIRGWFYDTNWGSCHGKQQNVATIPLSFFVKVPNCCIAWRCWHLITKFNLGFHDAVGVVLHSVGIELEVKLSATQSANLSGTRGKMGAEELKGNLRLNLKFRGTGLRSGRLEGSRR